MLAATGENSSVQQSIRAHRMSMSSVIRLPNGYLHADNTLPEKCMLAEPWDVCIRQHVCVRQEKKRRKYREDRDRHE